ncbi:unnamed protein product [Clonostachys chloroleuca]|uniref:Hydroxymethylglutaryl-CoA reductase (NADPH) n=1 Tax=Clonostachys chloroleuca TaxID=1926264 RepID=A0AA35QBN6_9HYPO|nr:unnamed protein product [Clonostachys chloroleuca]
MAASDRTKKIHALVQEMKLEHILAAPEDVQSIKIENCVGYTKVPLGIAGPLRVSGTGVDGTLYAPLATQEATLVASCSRGCKALSVAGVRFEVLSQGMSRAPVFMFDSPEGAVLFARGIPEILDEFGQWAASTGRFVRLQSTKIHILGSQVHLYCNFHCGAAAGQNMVTKAVNHACHQLLKSYGPKYQIKDWFVDGQMSSDKKPSWGNVKAARGVEVMAWGSLDNEKSLEILGCTTERLYQFLTTITNAGIRNGQFGSNANTANVLAAMFIATGQDAASLGEACWSQLTPEYNQETKILTLSLYFPSLPVATIGGGTGNATQKEALRILHCDGPEHKEKLAGLMASFALALEISTIAAISNGTFSDSHMRLARGEIIPKL